MFAVRRTVLKSKNLTRTAGLVNNTANRRWFSTDGANPKVFFDIQIGEQKAGRVVFEVCDSFFFLFLFFRNKPPHYSSYFSQNNNSCLKMLFQKLQKISNHYALVNSDPFCFFFEQNKIKNQKIFEYIQIQTISF